MANLTKPVNMSADDQHMNLKSTLSDNTPHMPLLDPQIPPPSQNLMYQPQFQPIQYGQPPIDGAHLEPGALPPRDYVAPRVKEPKPGLPDDKKYKNRLPYNPDQSRPRRQVQAKCDACGHHGLTDVEFTGNCTTCLCCSFLLITTGVLFWIPCVINTCKDARHYCRNCHRQIGISKR